MKNIKINLKNRSYLINIDYKLLNLNKKFFSIKRKTKIMLITNVTVDNLWKKKIICFLSKLNAITNKIVLPDGEKYKKLKYVNTIITKLLELSYDRKSILIALGGGVIGDITGFVASIYQRGINFIQIPTTLLSQVDASIGGKTGVNHILGKNMIGSFWQPSCVLVDLEFLNKLPYKELLSGLAEVIKYAIAFDESFFYWLKKNIDKLISLDFKYMSYCIKKCCIIKSKIIENDEKEKKDRFLLNLGHTYGHAIESYLGYGKWLHGEAVSAGIIMAAYTGEELNILEHKYTKNIIKLIKKVKLPIKGPNNMYPNDYLKYMIRDKKTSYDTLRMVIPTKIGEVKLVNISDKKIIISAINKAKQHNY
ncbi:3-dehydroquinate synthase [Buchnera aphidicola (Taiwanaphis decaspermi)]|uniref:3-dehydroquinate synthase n=1 Tax=Buchnera aphidicola TaxID=9 RepID=UPI0031B839F5